MPSTTNFGWTTPADSDYVKDGASAIRTLAGGIDTSMAQLKGGTAGQILSKTNGTDMAFTWINNDQGDITSVGVTSPITGGGTSGAVTIAIQDASTTQKGAVQLTDSTSSTSTTTAATPNSVKSAYDLANGAIQKTLTTTTGDLIYASSANTPARLGIGSSNQVLTVSGGVPVWASPAGGGKVLQVVQATTTTSVSSTSTTYADTNLSASITPSATTSKILVLVHQNGVVKSNGNASNAIALRLVRGSTEISLISATTLYTATALEFWGSTVSTAYLDSPSTTSSITYKTQFNNPANTNTVYVNLGSSMSTITLLEIGA